MPPTLKAEIIQKLEKYQRDFSAWAEGAQTSPAVMAQRCRNSFGDRTGHCRDVSWQSNVDHGEAGAAEAATRDSIQLWMLIALAVDRSSS